MDNPKLFQYAILYHPLEKQIKDDGAKSKVITDIKTVLAKDERSAMIMASMDIPAEYKEQIDQIVIALRPF